MLSKSANLIKLPSSQILDVLCNQFRCDIEHEILQDPEVIKRASAGMTALAMVNKHAEVVHPGNTTQYYKLPVEFGGFCAWSLVKRNGLVTPGDKNNGMVRYKDKLLAFSDFEKAVDFFKNPEGYFLFIYLMQNFCLGILRKSLNCPRLDQVMSNYSTCLNFSPLSIR